MSDELTNWWQSVWAKLVYLASAKQHTAVNKLLKSEQGGCDKIKAPAPVCSHRRSPVSTIPHFICLNWESPSW